MECVFQATMFWFPVKSVHSEFGGLSWMTGTPFLLPMLWADMAEEVQQ